MKYTVKITRKDLYTNDLVIEAPSKAEAEAKAYLYYAAGDPLADEEFDRWNQGFELENWNEYDIEAEAYPASLKGEGNENRNE